MKRYTVALLLVGAWACTDSNAPGPPAVPPPGPPPPPPPPASFAIRPALDTVVVGDWVRFVAESGGGSSVDQWILSDTSRARLLGHARDWAAVRIRAAGTVTIKATRGADTGQATLVIRPQDTPPAPVTIGNWEAISLGLMDNERGGALAISETGTIVGVLSDAGQYRLGYGFIYEDGVMQKLWSSDSLNRDYEPRAIGASEKIVGVTSFMSPGRLLVWDSADAAPRFLGDGFAGGVVGINAQGDFLVDYEIDGFRAALWRNNVRVDLGALGDTVEAGSGSLAAAWNDAGQIVGGSTVAGLFHPFIWENGVMRDLGVLGSECLLPPGKNCSSGHATAINAHGVVVGKSTTDSMSRAFIWKDGVMRDLGVFPGHSTRALAINDHGQVLGAVGDAGWRRTQRDDFSARDTIFLWDNDRLDVVTTATIVQLWLTPDGTVVGTTLVEHEQRAFVWEAGVLTDLGPRSWVKGVNSHGEIVGWRSDMPTLWRRKGS